MTHEEAQRVAAEARQHLTMMQYKLQQLSEAGYHVALVDVNANQHRYPDTSRMAVNSNSSFTIKAIYSHVQHEEV